MHTQCVYLRTPNIFVRLANREALLVKHNDAALHCNSCIATMRVSDLNVNREALLVNHNDAAMHCNLCIVTMCVSDLSYLSIIINETQIVDYWARLEKLSKSTTWNNIFIINKLLINIYPNVFFIYCIFYCQIKF